MLEAAWLLAAIELNGALISRGAGAQLTDRDCIVEARAIAPHLTPTHRNTNGPNRQWRTDPKYCSFHPAEGLLRIKLPQHYLTAKTLTLGESSSKVNVALLHDPKLLSQHPEYAAQPSTQTIPAATVDLFVGSGLNGLGAALTHGPWSLQSLYQQPDQSDSVGRATAEYFFLSGAQIRAGDFRTESGPEQRFGEYRGLLLTNRAAPLRGDGKAEATLAIASPSRVQFFDRNGVPIYASEILAPGNYQIQGFGASTLPGFLEARLVDINGISQSVTLPWSADRRLLSGGQTEWELFSGRMRQAQGELERDTTHAARLRIGLHQNWTGGAYLHRDAAGHQEHLEINSRAIPNLIGTLAIGRGCSADHCTPAWFAEARSAIGRGLNLIASASQTLPDSSHDQPQRTALLALAGALHSRANGTIQIAQSSNQSAGTQIAKAMSITMRLTPQASLQAQIRHQQADMSPSAWSGFIGLTFYFSKHKTSVSSYLNLRSGDGGHHYDRQLTTQANYGNGSLYGPQIHLAHTHDRRPKSDGFLRYASPYGDASLHADTRSDRSNWSLSTRLWLTQEGATLTPAGDDNLVIQKLGLPSIRMRHSGRDSQTTGANGIAIFRKAPAWTDSTYTIDAKSMPFGANLATSRVRIPLAANRAYLVDYRGLWSAARSWRLVSHKDNRLPEGLALQDRFGKSVFFTPDGYVDLQSSDQLPLTARMPNRAELQCGPDSTPPANAANGNEVQLSCQPLPPSGMF